MQKSLEQIQKENRKFILEAIHGCSYEEALEKELGVGCKIILEGWLDIKSYDYTITDTDTFKISRDQIIEVIGKPLTLSRVLLAFKNKEVKTCYGDKIIFNIAGSQFCELSVEDKEAYATTYTVYGICLWNLAIDEIPLEEQTEETQRAINELFNNQ